MRRVRRVFPLPIQTLITVCACRACGGERGQGPGQQTAGGVGDSKRAACRVVRVRAKTPRPVRAKCAVACRGRSRASRRHTGIARSMRCSATGAPGSDRRRTRSLFGGGPRRPTPRTCLAGLASPIRPGSVVFPGRCASGRGYLVRLVASSGATWTRSPSRAARSIRLDRIARLPVPSGSCSIERRWFAPRMRPLRRNTGMSCCLSGSRASRACR